MAAPRSSASHASVVFLRVHDFAQQVIPDQARLKSWLEEVVAGALPVLGAADQGIVLDAPEGLAVVVLANPRGALRLAWRASVARDYEFSIGVAHGPVRLAPGPLHVIYGDALVAAEAVASAAEAFEVSVSRSFRDALDRAHPGMKRLFTRAGAAIDAHDRSHDVFRAEQRAVNSRRRSFFSVMGFTAVIILGLGLAIRMNRPPPPPPPKPPEPPPGAVTFEVKPEGEIYIDGALKGVSPPLKRVQLPAGRHVIEIRNGTLKPLVTELMIGSNEEFAVQHTFIIPTPPKAAPKPAPKAPAKQAQKPQGEEKSLWQRFLDWFK
jgi:hypothetical protein